PLYPLFARLNKVPGYFIHFNLVVYVCSEHGSRQQQIVIQHLPFRSQLKGPGSLRIVFRPIRILGLATEHQAVIARWLLGDGILGVDVAIRIELVERSQLPTEQVLVLLAVDALQSGVGLGAVKTCPVVIQTQPAIKLPTIPYFQRVEQVTGDGGRAAGGARAIALPTVTSGMRGRV